MLRRRAPEEDSAVLIDMAQGMEKGDSYGSIANTSQVILHYQGLRVQEAQHSPLAPTLGFRPWSKVDTRRSLGPHTQNGHRDSGQWLALARAPGVDAF